MSALEQIIYPVVETDWHGLYGESWQGDLVPAAFSHPAKYSRALIRRIYDHATEEGWIRPGSTVVDPFGGVAGGALDAMLHGCHWRGCELEQDFVELGGQNIALWNERYSRMPSWGTAELRQGDSRQLASVFAEGDLSVSSPPFLGARQNTTKSRASQSGGDVTTRNDAHAMNYAANPQNLANLSATDDGFDCAISSPPYAGARIQQAGEGGGNEANMRRSNDRDPYGATPGQLGGLKDTGFDAAISSPPFERQIPQQDKNFTAPHDSTHNLKAEYGRTDGQLGIAAGEDFWQASRLILEQLFEVLTPGGHAVFVTKRFVRKKQVVEFSAQWAALCEAVGFRQIHHHRCWLVESHGTRTDLFGVSTEVKTERKSFFRRLAEKKGSPRIDFEDVLCFVKPSY